MRKFDEGAFQARHIVPVGIHVVGIDVGHDGHHRQQIQERRIGLIGLDHDVVALPQPRVGARRVQASADHESGVQVARGKHAGHQAGSGGLAMRAGYRDATLQAHQLRQHDGTRHHGDTRGPRGDHFGVVARHRGGRDDGGRARDVAGHVADGDLHAQPSQAARNRRLVQVGPADRVAQVEQHFGNAAHARAADAYEMDMLNSVFHDERPAACSQTSAIWAAASGRA
ncbi:hypothetical protein D3C72_1411050 [compost metagenome]